MKIFLVGFMGCGKSTIGKRVARRLGYEFADTDSMIEEREGMSVSEVFAKHGEKYFRELETETLAALPADGDMIIATGGGLPCYGENMKLMKQSGEVVYFKTSPEMLVGRLAHGRAKRPKIAGMDDEQLLAFIESSLAEREPFYSQASMTIDCNGVDDKYIASHIVHFIKNI